jgi:hypothetical protein
MANFSVAVGGRREEWSRSRRPARRSDFRARHARSPGVTKVIAEVQVLVLAAKLSPDCPSTARPGGTGRIDYHHEAAMASDSGRAPLSSGVDSGSTS